MFIINYAICLTVFGLSISKVYGQCTFTDPFLSSTWLDNTKDTLVFTTNQMSGWAFNALRTTGNPLKINTWQCVDYVPDKYLVLRTIASFTVDILGTNTPRLHAYLCMKLTKITNTSYIYYQQNAQRSRLGYERLHVTSNASLTNYTQVCDDSITVPTTEYHVIIKSGQAANSVITCPDSLLFSADYYVTGSDGTSNCTNTNDVWDVCSNITQMTFNYSTCSTQVMFSAGGVLSCVANVSSGGYDYVTVYNQDATLTGTATRFACISTSGRYSSVAPGNCTATQTPWAVPVKADQVTKVGQLLVITNYYQTCCKY
ncbi:uncharacterized protein LOC127875997 [Dreissena polymorpha]|uniref:uncharacterized protein LOC127875997 n=1 Tax=Dreissena polymorpha TaxID=45954 RepID=UPI00226420B7|nr:uncharacterized protein LOC127875997 [Dreissena polymorpha]